MILENTCSDFLLKIDCQVTQVNSLKLLASHSVFGTKNRSGLLGLLRTTPVNQFHSIAEASEISEIFFSPSFLIVAAASHLKHLRLLRNVHPYPFLSSPRLIKLLWRKYEFRCDFYL